MVNARADLTAVLDRHFPWCSGWEPELKQLFGAYVAAKQQSGVLDFDDLLLYWAAMMEEPAIAREIGAMFDHVLIDEYQDTNRIQAQILAGLKPDGRGVTVVGDDAQSIYSFRAAEVRNILDFPGQFDPPARSVALTRNYRSTPQILDAANAVIAEAEEAFDKALWSGQDAGLRPALVTVRDEGAQVDYVCREILAARETGTQLREQAVLFRTSHHSGPLEVELTRRDIPFVKFGGLKFLEAAHVKDVLSTLQFIQNPRDRVAGFRTLMLIPGVGPATAERVIDAMAGGPAEALRTADVPGPAAQGVAAFADLFGRLRRPEWPADLEAVCDWYDPHLERRHEDATARRADLVQLRQIASGFPRPRAVPDGHHAGPAGRIVGHRRPAASRRRLPGAVDDPFGQGARVAARPRAELRRRLHPVRALDRDARRDRGGAPPALRRDDARQAVAAPDPAAALLCPQPGEAWRPPRLRDPVALHDPGGRRDLRGTGLARGP